MRRGWWRRNSQLGREDHDLSAVLGTEPGHTCRRGKSHQVCGRQRSRHPAMQLGLQLLRKQHPGRLHSRSCRREGMGGDLSLRKGSPRLLHQQRRFAQRHYRRRYSCLCGWQRVCSQPCLPRRLLQVCMRGVIGGRLHSCLLHRLWFARHAECARRRPGVLRQDRRSRG